MTAVECVVVRTDLAIAIGLAMQTFGVCVLAICACWVLFIRGSR